MIERLEGETLGDYAARITEKLRVQERARRDNEPRYDVERHLVEQLEEQGMPVCETAYPLQPRVTPNHLVRVLEIPHLAGLQLRVTSERTSLGDVPYSHVLEFREGNAAWINRALDAVLRQLMVAQRDEAVAWLEANPEREVDVQAP